MKYTTEQLNKDCQKIIDEELVPIRIDRGKRYGDADFNGDTLANVAAFDWIGAAIPAYECAKRIQREVLRVIRQHECANKATLENACLDGINYLLYTLILLRRKLEVTDCDVQTSVQVYRNGVPQSMEFLADDQEDIYTEADGELVKTVDLHRHTDVHIPNEETVKAMAEVEAGTVTGTCGHILPDDCYDHPERHEVATKDHDRDGSHAVSLSFVCEPCKKKYKDAGIILETEAEQDEWLGRKLDYHPTGHTPEFKGSKCKPADEA